MAEVGTASASASSRISVAGIFVAFAAGVYLRLQGLGTQLVFADEIHALNIVGSQGYGFLFTHFSLTDACIPLTLYDRLLMDTVGLNEISMRLPSVLCGCATILLLAYFTWRRFGPLGAWLAAGLIALSPYHVFLSREARPYPIVIFLLLIAAMAVLRWSREGNAGSLYLAAAVCFASLYFHLLALPMVGCLGLYVFATAWRRAERRPAVAWSTGIFVLLCLVFFLPAHESLAATMAARVALGHQQLATARDGLFLFWGLSEHDWLWQAGAVITGAAVLQRVRRGEALLFGALLIGQVAAVAAASPENSEIPWVWARYVVFALPLWIALAAGGASALLGRIRLRYFGEAIVGGVLTGLFVYGIGLYGLGPNHNFIVHPMVMARELNTPAVLASLPVPAFYRRMPAGSGAVLEMPLVMVFPLYDLEQRIHRRPVYSAGMGCGMWQDVFNDTPGFHFARMSKAGAVETKPPIAYVIIHKAVGDEMRRVYERLLAIPTERRQLAGFADTFSTKTTQQLFGKSTALQKWAAAVYGTPVYEDNDVVVYQPARLDGKLSPLNRLAPCGA